MLLNFRLFRASPLSKAIGELTPAVRLVKHFFDIFVDARRFCRVLFAKQGMCQGRRLMELWGHDCTKKAMICHSEERLLRRISNDIRFFAFTQNDRNGVFLTF